MSEVLQDVWNRIQATRPYCGSGSDADFYAVWSAIVLLITYYLHGWLFVLADWYGFLDAYAIRGGKHRLPSMKQQWDAVGAATLDCFVVKPLFVYVTYPLIGKPFIQFDSTLPSLQKMFLDFFILQIVYSTSLYTFHRMMHDIPWLYKNVHKQHHSFHESVGFTALYAHWGEAAISTLHVIIGVVLVQPHFFVYLCFFGALLVEIVDAHCGYDVPWKALYMWSDVYPWGSGARIHDYHHSHNLGSYGGGLLGLWDRLLGTDYDFRMFENKRVLVSMGLLEPKTR